MRWVVNLLRFFIPFIVLYSIGYYIPGFSALTVSWIFFLSILVFIGDWLVEKFFKTTFLGRFQKGVISFLVSTMVVLIATLAIQGGNVPLGSALLAALIIGVLINLIPDVEKNNVSEVRK